MEHVTTVAASDAPNDWYETRVIGGLMAYWTYRHLGNLSLQELAKTRRINVFAKPATPPPSSRDGRTGTSRSLRQSGKLADLSNVCSNKRPVPARSPRALFRRRSPKR
jgi:hypothetical protein